MRDPFSYRALSPDTTTIGSVSRELFEYIDKHCVPLEATWEITLQCNLKCKHCYNFNRQEPISSDVKKAQLTKRQGYRLIDQVYEEGCLNLTLTGGEPLMHPHIFEFAAYARRKHMGVYVKSNGTLLTPGRIGKMLGSRIMGIEVSLYGASQKTHDRFTDTPGSFGKSLQGLKNVKQAGIHTRITFIITSQNAAEAQAMIDLAETLEIEYGLNPQISARYRGANDTFDFQPTRQQLMELYSGPFREHLPEPDYNPGRSVQCGCARGVCGISATGDVYPCIGAPVKAGNLKEKSFSEIWKYSEQLNEIRNLKLEDFKDCKPCPHRPFCRRSSGFVYVNTGNYTGPDPWTCMEAEVIHEIYKNAE